MILCIVTSCREDEIINYTIEESTGKPIISDQVKGMYVLCEGNMGFNKCTLDYLDLSNNDQTAHYYRNIYPERNPNIVKELGDVGNDIGIYGSKLWIVVNCSNKVEVCDKNTAKHIGQIEIANGRYLAFDQGFAYISSFAGPVKIDENCPLGYVFKVDTLTLQKVDSITVGFQPEEMAITDNKLYVANSGGYRVPNYDNRVTVIDLETFTIIQHIEVDINLHRMAADRYGQIWVSSRGDYYGHSPSIYWLKDGNIGKVEVPVSAMSLVGDSLYYIGSMFNYNTGTNSHTFGIIDVKTHEPIMTSIFDAPETHSIMIPYGIVVNPNEKDFYLMDAKNYISSGELLHFLPDGTFDWKVKTGDIPTKTAFLYEDN